MVFTLKQSGAGRIIFWSGGSLWIGLSGEPTQCHAHHAIQVSVSLSGTPLQFRTPDTDWQSFDAAVIAAHAPHAFAAPRTWVAMIFIEPESGEGQALTGLCTTHPVVAIDTNPALAEITTLFAQYQAVAEDARLAATARELVSRYTASPGSGTANPDKRIGRARALIRERIDGTVTLAAIAGMVHLSPDRFRHLFLEETGMRFRPYVLWVRIETALAAYAAGKNLTEAAQTGGFADSAHFSRTFVRMFGISPSSLRID